MSQNKEKSRAYLVLRDILLADGYIKMEDLADRHFVSNATMYRIFKECKEIIEQYGLSVTVRPNHGVKVDGPEARRRACFSACWHNLVSEEKASMIEQCGFPLEQAQSAEYLVRSVLEKHGLVLADNIIENLAIHILYAIKRIKAGEVIEPIGLLGKPSQNELDASQDLKQRIEEEFSLTIPDSEISYILLQLQCKSSYGDHDLPVSVQTEELLEDILEALHEDYLVDFTNDQELRDLLSIHMESMLKRVQFGMHMPNPLLEEVKGSWPAAFEYAVFASKKIQAALNTPVSEDELGYLALHFGLARERMVQLKPDSRVLVVCSTGRGTAQVLKNRLRNKLGIEIQNISMSSANNLKNMDIDRFDCIVTTVPLAGTFTQPVYLVRDLLSDFQLLSQSRAITFAGILNPDTILIHPRLKNRQEIIHALSEMIRDTSGVTDQLEDLIIDREILASTDIGNFVAVPHPDTICTDRTLSAVCILKKPVLWNRQEVKYVFLLCLGKEDLYMAEDINEDLFSRLTDKGFLDRLSKVESVEELIELFEEPLQ